MKPQRTCLLVVLLTLFVAAPTFAKEPRGGAPVEDADSQVQFGVEMARRGLWSEALFRFKQADRIRPGDPKILNNIAVSFEALGYFEKALEYYQNAIKGDPGNKELKRNYSRFVEFYRNFRPDQQTGAEERAGSEGP